MLQDLFLAATNDALKKVEELTNQTMGQFTKGMNLPGFLGGTDICIILNQYRS